MKFNVFIGVDISKLTLDIAVVGAESIAESFRIGNNAPAIEDFFLGLSKEVDLCGALICAEHTGHYGYPLREFCLSQGHSLWLEGGAEIKLRSGVTRYKNDSVDAVRIADYARRFHDRARIERVDDHRLESLKALASERDLYIRERAKYRAQLNDLKDFMEAETYRAKSSRLKGQVERLDAVISEVEEGIKQIIASSQRLSRQKEILKSLDGVGEQVALQTIIATNGFSKFGSGRKFACHVGVAPFSYESGSSQRSRRKVSHKANRALKSLFHMAALSAIKMEGEFKRYFERKVAEGKNKMTVINAVRAKIINRIFALIRDDRKYQKNYNPNFV